MKYLSSKLYSHSKMKGQGLLKRSKINTSYLSKKKKQTDFYKTFGLGKSFLQRTTEHNSAWFKLQFRISFLHSEGFRYFASMSSLLYYYHSYLSTVFILIYGFSCLRFYHFLYMDFSYNHLIIQKHSHITCSLDLSTPDSPCT